MSKVKIIVLCVIISLVIMFISGLTLLFIFEDDYSIEEKINIEDTSEIKIYDVERSGDKVTGKLKNTLNETIDYIEIGLSLYKNEIKLDEDFTNTTKLRKNEVWKFEFYLNEEDIDDYICEINELDIY